MNHYEKYSIDDFVSDDFFCSWVLRPDEQNSIFWENFKNSDSNNSVKIEAASKIVLQLNQATSMSLPAGMLEDTWSKIEQKTKKTKIVRFNWWKFTAAASVAAILGWFIFDYNPNNDTQIAEVSTVSQNQWTTQLNEGTSVKRLTLSDGSVVTLEPGSALKYKMEFGRKTRSVVLEGEGFFDIAHNPEKPFYVYANETVIRVLGTSFFVKAKDSHEDVEVIVKTGKVEVFKRKDIEELQKLPTLKVNSLKVTPNQKVVFNRNKELMSKRITATPTLVKPVEELPRLKFSNAPAVEIFEALSGAYGIDISIKPNAVINCPLTTTLNEQNLFEKLDIICKPLGLTYHEQDAKIIISGNCNS